VVISRFCSPQPDNRQRWKTIGSVCRTVCLFTPPSLCCSTKLYCFVTDAMCANNFCKVALDSTAAGIEPAISNCNSNARTTMPHVHTLNHIKRQRYLLGNIYFTVHRLNDANNTVQIGNEIVRRFHDSRLGRCIWLLLHATEFGHPSVFQPSLVVNVASRLSHAYHVHASMPKFICNQMPVQKHIIY